jgi:hypothetical protein
MSAQPTAVPLPLRGWPAEGFGVEVVQCDCGKLCTLWFDRAAQRYVPLAAGWTFRASAPTAGWTCGAPGHAPMPVRSPERPADEPTEQNPCEDTPAGDDAPAGRVAQFWPPPDPADLAADLDAEGNVRPPLTAADFEDWWDRKTLVTDGGAQ